MEHPENYDLERQQREIDRKVKDVVDECEIGVKEEADAEAAKVEQATDKTEESGDYKITLKKGQVIEAGNGVVLRLVKDTEFETVGAANETAAAGMLAASPALYGAVISDLSHEREINGVKHNVTFGAHGIEIAEPVAQPKQTGADAQAQQLGEKFLNVLKEAQGVAGTPMNTNDVQVAPGNAGKGVAAKAHAADAQKVESAVAGKKADAKADGKSDVKSDTKTADKKSAK